MTDAELVRAIRASELPSELTVMGWHRPTHEREPIAVVTYAEEPSPETGHEGWCWWAAGKMGEARSFRAAQRAAERRLGDPEHPDVRTYRPCRECARTVAGGPTLCLPCAKALSASGEDDR